MQKPTQIWGAAARAKINLTLHVGSARPDGYHPLHSLVVFADISDRLQATPASEFNLTIDGPFAGGLPRNENNLVLKAVDTLATLHGLPARLSYRLTKNLPVSSGIGGGSADAAAAVHILAQANHQMPKDVQSTLLEVGADVPVCYLSKTCVMQGIGEALTPLGNLGQLPAILVNPGIAVRTADIFKAFDEVGHSSDFHLAGKTLREMTMSGQNDLQDIAIRLAPVIHTVLEEITAQTGCDVARMSGSGATCFGVFTRFEHAQMASQKIKENHPHWWCVPTLLGDAD